MILAYLALQYTLSEVDIHLVALLMITKACESVMILDRWFYLTEQGFNAKVVPIFDVKISPRNLAILAFKDTNKT